MAGDVLAQEDRCRSSCPNGATSMNFQELTYFVSAARWGSFSRAANECYVSQSTLSRGISRLERELGGPLFVRGVRTVKLTPLGGRCLHDAKELLAVRDRLLDRARDQETLLSVRVGSTNDEYFYRFLSRIGSLQDRLDISVLRGRLEILRKKLIAGDIDFALFPEATCCEVPGARCARVSSSGARALLPRSNPLSERESVSISDLANLPFIAWDDDSLPGANASFIRLFLQAGYKVPRQRGLASAISEAVVLAKRFGGFACIANALAATIPEDMAAIPIEESSGGFGIVCLWLEDSRSSAVALVAHSMEGSSSNG